MVIAHNEPLILYGFSNDDMPTCPKCATRAEITKEINDSSYQLKCLNHICAYEFIGEWND